MAEEACRPDCDGPASGNLQLVSSFDAGRLLQETLSVEAEHASNVLDSASTAVAVAASASSKSLQPRLLKHINQLSTREELLAYVHHCHHLLDAINLVTVLYRLARICSFIQSSNQKFVWKAELLESPSFALLLNVIRNHLNEAQAILNHQPDVSGINARCLSNLVWSIVKLEMTSEHGHAVAGLGVDVALSAAPLVLRYLKDCSGQGLSNLLWSFAKIQASPAAVMTAIVSRMVELLETPESSALLDAQALSNSIWAIAHVRSRPNELDNDDKWQNIVTNFLLLVTNQCLTVLSGGRAVSSSARGSVRVAQHFTATTITGGNDGRFSCQAVVNIAWSFSTILGSACGIQDPVRPLFLLIRELSIQRLQAILSGNINSTNSGSTLTGSFNEQALSNLVYAFDRAQLLNQELLQAVFDMAAVRLCRPSTGSQGLLGFKPQELCTLLRACHLGVAQPWAMLASVSRLVTQYPSATAAWTPAEMLDLHNALQLVRSMPPQYGMRAQRPALSAIPPMMASVPPNSTASPQMLQSLPSTAPHSYAPTPHVVLGGATNTYNSVAAAPPRPQQLILRYEPSSDSTVFDVLGESRVRPVSDAAYMSEQSYLSQSANETSGVGCGVSSTVEPVSLQQVWVMDQAGNLQPTTLVLQQPQGPSTPQPHLNVRPSYQALRATFGV